MATYTFTFKKDDIFVNFTTTDKDLIERQFKIWVTCASVYAYNQEMAEKGLNVESLPKVPAKPVEITPTKEELKEIKEEIPQPQKDIPELKQEFAKSIGEDLNISAVEAAEQKEEILDEMFKPTVNSIQNPPKEEIIQEEPIIEKPQVEVPQVQEPKPLESKEDFNAIFEEALTKTEYIPQIKKDEKFLKVLRVKNVKEKLDFLIVTAYYLSEFENLIGFTLKQINAKLMENINEVIDHGVLQDAKDLGYIELIPNSTNVTSGAEYRLTESGENAFLNGRA